MSYNSHAKDIFIITGASRGLGRAIASELAGTETVIVLINRANAKAAVNEMRQKGAQVYTLSCDLSRVEKVTRLADVILKKVALRQARSLTLINCAGIITPIGFAGEVNAQEALKNLHVNAVSPILLSHGFLNISKRFKGVRLIVNISTGAAKRPIAGWGLYCSAKAAPYNRIPRH